MDYRIFDDLLKAHNTTAYRVAKGTGIAPSTFSDWKSGRSAPKADKLRKIAAYLGVSVDTLFGGSHARGSGGEDPFDREMSDAGFGEETAGELSPDGMTAGGAILVYPARRYRLPIIGEIRAGSPIITEETVLGYEDADVDAPSEYFYLRVCGDSMKNCGMVDGSVVLFHKQTYAENGEVVACLVGGESATVKRFRKEAHRILLCPENDDYRPIELSPIDFETGEARIMGVAIEIRIRDF